jgi:hypothetical protein
VASLAAPWLDAELVLLHVRVVVAPGAFAWEAALPSDPPAPSPSSPPASRRPGRRSARPPLASRAGHWQMRTHPDANQTWRATYTVSTQHFSRRVPNDRRVPIGCLAPMRGAAIAESLVASPTSHAVRPCERRSSRAHPPPPVHPEGPGSVSGAPNLPARFTDTFTSRYIDTGAPRLRAVIGGEGPPLLVHV